MYKNNFVTLVVSFLMVAFTTTNNMEMVPFMSSKKFEKTNNIICNYNLNDKNTELSKNQRPTIKVNLYIDHDNRCAHYVESNYYNDNSINNDAVIISSIKNQQKMPHIRIIAIDDRKNDWTHNGSCIMADYEYGEDIEKILFSDILKKKFPALIPADILHGYKTGDKINFTIHKYPVIATCTDNPNSKQSFQKDFSQHITNFIRKPRVFSDSRISDSRNDSDYGYVLCKRLAEIKLMIAMKELTDAGLINDSGEHGPNGFTSIGKLLYEDKNISSNICDYLKQREYGQKKSKISSQKTFQLIERKESSWQQNSNDEIVYEEDRGCIIS